MIIDISKKSDVYRYARASAEVNSPICNVAVAARAAAVAYKYLPFLHPLPIFTSAYCSGKRLYVEGLALWPTGVEMDVLFGVLTGAVASGSKEIGNLTVDVKIKGEVRNIASTTAQEAPLYREGGLEASAYGEMRLRNIDMVRGTVEKGHPIYAAQTAAALNVKRLCELVESQCPHIQYFKIDIEVRDVITVNTLVRSRDLPPGPEALFATGVALLTIWDMVKKYEKDEEGQYPYTRITQIALVKA